MNSAAAANSSQLGLTGSRLRLNLVSSKCSSAPSVFHDVVKSLCSERVRSGSLPSASAYIRLGTERLVLVECQSVKFPPESVTRVGSVGWVGWVQFGSVDVFFLALPMYWSLGGFRLLQRIAS
jgi:hypothetical protein